LVFQDGKSLILLIKISGLYLDNLIIQRAGPCIIAEKTHQNNKEVKELFWNDKNLLLKFINSLR